MVLVANYGTPPFRPLVPPGTGNLSFRYEARIRRPRAFYRHLGFADCGRLARQVLIDGVEDDELLMELFI